MYTLSISPFTTNLNNKKQKLYSINENRLKCVLKCAFSLTEEEAKVLAYLVVENNKAIAKDIAESLNRNPEVVRRALRSLHTKSLVVRKPYPLRKGGRAYLYEVPQKLIEMFSELCEKLDTIVEEFSNNKNH